MPAIIPEQEFSSGGARERGRRLAWPMLRWAQLLSVWIDFLPSLTLVLFFAPAGAGRIAVAASDGLGVLPATLPNCRISRPRESRLSLRKPRKTGSFRDVRGLSTASGRTSEPRVAGSNPAGRAWKSPSCGMARSDAGRTGLCGTSRYVASSSPCAPCVMAWRTRDSACEMSLSAAIMASAWLSVG